MIREIDINTDIGEGFGNYGMPHDEAIMALVTSANIACGFHGGDPLVMNKTVALAKKYGVAVGAHPGLPDLMGFGRRIMELNPEEIRNYIIYQVGALKGFVEVQGLKLHHIKFHGAFLRSTKGNEGQVRALVQAVLDIDRRLMLYCPNPLEAYHPILAKVVAEMGVRVIPEFYADLNYGPNGVLVPPRVSKLELTSSAAAQRVLRFLKEGKVTTTEGTESSFKALSVCIHSDSPRALELLKAIRDTLREAGIEVKSMD